MCFNFAQVLITGNSGSKLVFESLVLKNRWSLQFVSLKYQPCIFVDLNGHSPALNELPYSYYHSLTWKKGGPGVCVCVCVGGGASVCAVQ